jgi:2-keto-4-pentenoate hydratase/2-oxohepta-3-ene-1,7-dioic acid hydratase in catechol pathway
MKIFCIGRNYAAHAAEMNSSVPKKPMVFMKAKNALLLDNAPLYYPPFTEDLQYEVELVLKIDKPGKFILPEYAPNYYSELALGIDFTARDLQAKCKEKGHPWEIAKSFDHSALLSSFVPVKGLNKSNIEFHLTKNGEKVQHGFSKNMIFDFNTLIVYLSQFFSLEAGDLIYTGTPEGVGPVKVGDMLTGYLEEEEMFQCEIK